MPIYTQAQVDAIATELGNRIKERTEIFFHLGGQFLGDPNEINGWGGQGPFDNVNTQDLGNSGVATRSRVAGGFMYPFDVRLKRLFVRHNNNNSALEAWGWTMARQIKNAGSNTTTTTVLFNEVTDNGGVGPRNYASTVNQLTDIDLSVLPDPVIPAYEVVNLAIDTPTAIATNRYVMVQSGFIQMERVVPTS